MTQPWETDRPAPDGGYVYAVQMGGDGPIKIGWSANPQRRLAGLQCSSPYTLVVRGIWPGMPNDEARLHERLSAHRMRGEWFRPHSDVVTAIRHKLTLRLKRPEVASFFPILDDPREMNTPKSLLIPYFTPQYLED